jgi:hypothetical protein
VDIIDDHTIQFSGYSGTDCTTLSVILSVSYGECTQIYETDESLAITWDGGSASDNDDQIVATMTEYETSFSCSGEPTNVTKYIIGNCYNLAVDGDIPVSQRYKQIFEIILKILSQPCSQ